MLNDIDRFRGKKQFGELIDMKLITEDLNFATALVRPAEDENSDENYTMYRFTAHLLERAVVDRDKKLGKFKSPPPASGTGQLLNFWIQVTENDNLRMFDIKRFKGIKALRSVLTQGDSKVLTELANKIKTASDKACTLINTLKTFAARHNIHYNIACVKAILVSLGNMFSVCGQESPNSHLCSPDIIKSLIDLKSTPYCRDMQFLSFTVLACIPTIRSLSIISRRTKSRCQLSDSNRY